MGHSMETMGKLPTKFKGQRVVMDSNQPETAPSSLQSVCLFIFGRPGANWQRSNGLEYDIT